MADDRGMDNTSEPFWPPDDIDHRPVAVVGAGTLGRRIALMFATRGGESRLFDPDPAQRDDALAYVTPRVEKVVSRLEGATAGAVTVHAELADAVAGAWLVVEAVPERLELKRGVLAEVDGVAADDAIVATNSSSYPSSRFADAVSRPERLLNMHFYMPPRNNAVELMSSGATAPTIIPLLTERLPAYGLVPFEVRAESQGFIYNRIWAAIKREALAVVAEGVSTPEDVDRIFTLTLGAPFGPFRMMDAVGLDVVLDIEEHYADAREGIPTGPRDLLRQLIGEGRLGAKTGRGFYDDWDAGTSGE
jgi:3-hydroxybutyryl-CoA dehydrogenase